MLTDMKTLLKRAEEAKCAIPAFNVYNGETALGIIRAAEEANACAKRPSLSPLRFWRRRTGRR